MSELFSLERAGRWFLDSGIQDAAGGVARYYRSDLERNQPVSMEITGYAASTLTYLHSVTGEPEYLVRAAHTAEYLSARGWDPALRAFPFEPDSNSAYFFDSGIIIRGLLAVWRSNGERKLFETAVECGRAMVHDFDSGADFHPILMLPGKDPQARDARWSRSPGCYQLKSAMGWFELFEESPAPELMEAYRRQLRQSLATHLDFLPGEADENRVMDRLHAYCYFLEGLLPVARERECARAFAEGIDRASYYLDKIAPSFARSDVYAQLLRARLMGVITGILPLDEATAERHARELAAFQASSPDPRIDGGFYFGRKGGQAMPYVNPVSTGFGLQALAMWRQYEDGTLALCRQLLI